MKSSHDKHADVKIEFNSQCEAILSPDGKQKLLPCDRCGKLEWKALNVVGFNCIPCHKLYEQGCECKGTFHDDVCPLRVGWKDSIAQAQRHNPFSA